MKQELIKTAKTTEEAVKAAAEEFGVSVDEVEFEVLEEAKKGFFGMGAAPAKVKVTYIFKPLEAARSFAETLIKDMGIEATVTIHDDGNGEALLTISGEDAGTLIGHHGDTLDSLQYLINLAANKKETDERKYTRISVDIENYREKREETLKKLARHMAEKVKRTGRNVVLEPMNAYERRIIHSEVQGIEGVSTNSVGVEGNRRVILFPEGGEKPTTAKPERKGGKRRDGGKKRHSRPAKKADGAEKSAEKAEKAEKPAEKREREEYTPRPRRTNDAPRPAPRKIEKAKDLDSYFARLKEFGSTINSTEEKK
ncbi:MAG: Jag N-terminal domain-containing protein [Clostridia bacterium]|nr:Jag N-terminal domain-containing protein [Clostridia bacterium]